MIKWNHITLENLHAKLSTAWYSFPHTNNVTLCSAWSTNELPKLLRYYSYWIKLLWSTRLYLLGSVSYLLTHDILSNKLKCCLCLQAAVKCASSPRTNALSTKPRLPLAALAADSGRNHPPNNVNSHVSNTHYLVLSLTCMSNKYGRLPSSYYRNNGG